MSIFTQTVAAATISAVPLKYLGGVRREQVVEQVAGAMRASWPTAKALPAGLQAPSAVRAASDAYAAAMQDLESLVAPTIEAEEELQLLPATALPPPFDEDAARRAHKEARLQRGVREPFDAAKLREEYDSRNAASVAAAALSRNPHTLVVDRYNTVLGEACQAEFKLADAIFDARHAWLPKLRADARKLAQAAAEAEAVHVAARRDSVEVQDVIRALDSWQHDPEESASERRERLKSDAGCIVWSR